MDTSENFLINLQGLVGKELNQSPSNFMNWLRLTLLAAERGSMTCSYTVREEMINPYQILHGGVTAGIIDDLIGATVYTLGLHARYTTVNNNIDYFAPAKLGDKIIAKTSIIKQGKTIINVQCEIFLETNQRLIAKGTSNMLRLV
jgi:uncharacterized protein (TIGR00369 family)